MTLSLSHGSDFYVTGGTVPRDALCYVPRKADQDLLEGLRDGQFCYVLTSRQMGKSSLMVRTALRLREEATTCAILDLTAIGQNLDAERWYGGLLNQLGQQVDLEDELDDFWLSPRPMGPMQRFMQALQQIVLPSVAGRLVIFVDEIDAVRSLPFSADEFFAGIRECYNRRSQNPEFARLTFCLLGVATPSDLIRDTRTTPFNIGRRIELTDFTAEEAAPLTEGLGVVRRVSGVASADSGAQAILTRVLYWTGGHPYLTQRFCQAVAEALTSDALHPIPDIRHPASVVDRLCEELFLSSGARERDDNLIFVRERLLRSEVDLAALLDMYGRVRQGKRVSHEETNALVSLLRLSGIVKASDRFLMVRNRIYAHVFDRAWVRNNMPYAELWRQKRAYRRGMLRAATVAAGILLVVVALAGYALKQAREAGAARDDARRNLRTANTERNTARRLAATVQEINSRLTTSLAQTRQALTLAKQRGVAAQKATGRAEIEAEHARLAATAEKRESARAQQEAEANRATLYAAQMVQAQTNADEGAAWRTRDLLLSQLPGHGQKDLRGFEWRYLWRESGDVSLITFTDLQDSVQDVAISPNGRLLAYCSGHKVILRSLLDHKIVFSREAYEVRGTCALAFSPGGRLLALDHDHITSLLDLKSGLELASWQHYGLDLRRLRFSPDGHKLIAAGAEIHICDIATRNESAITAPGMTDAVFSPDGKRIYACMDRAVRVYDAHSCQVVEIYHVDESNFLSLALSPDGNLLAATSASGRVVLFDTSPEPTMMQRAFGSYALRRPLATIDAHRGNALAVAFAPDGKTFVTTGSDGSVRLWDTKAHTLLRTLPGHTTGVLTVCYAPDSKLLATGAERGVVKLWSIAPKLRETILEMPKTGGVTPQVSPNHRCLVAATTTTKLALTDLATGAQSALSYQGKPITVFRRGAIDGDGKFLYGYTYANQIEVWEHLAHRRSGGMAMLPGDSLGWLAADGTVHVQQIGDTISVRTTQDGREVGRFAAKSGTTCLLADDGAMILASSRTDNGLLTIRLWHQGETTTRTLLETRDAVTPMQIARDGSAAAFYDGTTHAVYVARLSDGKRLHTVALLPESADVQTHFTADLQRMVTNDRITGNSVYYATASLYDVAAERRIGSYTVHFPIIPSTTFLVTPDGKRILSFQADAARKVWHVFRGKTTGTEEKLLSGHGEAQFVRYLPDGRLVLLEHESDQEGWTLRVHDLATGKEQTLLRGELALAARINGLLGVSDDGRTVALRHYSRTHLRWNLATGKAQALPVPGDFVTRPQQVSEHGRTMLSWNVDGAVTLVTADDVDTGKRIATLHFTGGLSEIRLSPDGESLLTRENPDGKIVLRQLRTGRHWQLALPPRSHIPDFSPDSRLLLTAEGNEVVLRAFPTGNLQHVLRGHTDRVTTYAFSLDGRLLATGSADRTIRIWDVSTGTERGRLEGHTGLVTGLAWTPEGRTLVSSAEDRTVRLWNMATQQEVARYAVEPGALVNGFSTDGRVLVVGYGQERFWLWRAPDMQDIAAQIRLEAPRPAPNAVSSVMRAAATQQRSARLSLLRGMRQAVPKIGSQMARQTAFEKPRDTAAMAATAPLGIAPPQASKRSTSQKLLQNPDDWSLNVVEDGKAAQRREYDGTLMVNVQRGDPEGWYVCLHRNLASLGAGRHYILRFRAKADRDHPVSIWLQQDVLPFPNRGIRCVVTLTEQWQEFRLPFTIGSESEAASDAMKIFLGKALGNVWFKDLTFVSDDGGNIPSDLLAGAAIADVLPTDNPKPGNGDIYVGTNISPDYSLVVGTSQGLRNWFKEESGVITCVYPAGQQWGFVNFSTSRTPRSDFSDYTDLLVDLKGAHGGETVRVGVKTDKDPNNGQEPRYLLSKLTTQWQTYRVPLARLIQDPAYPISRFKHLHVVMELSFGAHAPQTISFRNVRYTH